MAPRMGQLAGEWSSARAQAPGVTRVNQAMSPLDAVPQSNAAHPEETASASAERAVLLPREAAHQGAQRKVECDDEQRAREQPRRRGVHAGPAEAHEKGAGIVAESGDERGHGQRDGRGAPEEFAGADIDEDEDELERAEELVESLEDRLVQAEAKAGDEIGEPREAEERQERAGGAEGEREREAVGRGALDELIAQRREEAALPERGARSGGGHEW